MNFNITTILAGLILTCTFEGILFYIFGYKTKKFIIVSILANIFTNLALNFTIYFFDLVNSDQYWIYFIVGETLVVIVESIIYLSFFKKKYELIPLTFSANALTILLGFLFYTVIS